MSQTLAPDEDMVLKAPLSQGLWPRLGLAVAAILAGALNFWNLSLNDWGNPYYAAAVRSMLGSWQAFQFACFDPACFVTVDKPPLAFWVEAASARLFGFDSLGLLGPSALAGTISVAVLGHTVSRLFGTWAGLLAAVTLALTPVSVVTSRSNNPDALLVLLVVLATWASVHLIQSGQWRWVVLGALFFGLAFLTKMLAAFLVVPAVVVAYVACGPNGLRMRLLQILSGGAIVAAISFGWMLCVDLIPAAARPWVGGAPSNSEVGLAFGSNGLQRIFGMAALGAGNEAVYLYVSSGGTPVAINPAGGGPSVGSAAGAAFGGAPGFSRLLTGTLAAQGSWLVPLAVAGFLSALVDVKRVKRRDRLAGLIVFGGWTGVAWVAFSFATGVFHPYYISELAPGIAALVGIGIVALGRDALSRTWRKLLPAAALVSTGLFEWSVLDSEQSLGAWRWGLVAVSVAAALVLAAQVAVRSRAAKWGPAAGRSVLIVGLAALQVAPGAWTIAVPSRTANGMIPMALGPESRPAASGGTQGIDVGRLLAFLEGQAGQDHYLLATDSPPIGGVIDALIARSGKNVIPLSGFGGPGPLTRQQLVTWVDNSEVRYFLLGDLGARSALTSDIRRLCPTVAPSEWGGSEAGGATRDIMYDCAGKGSQLVGAASGAP